MPGRQWYVFAAAIFVAGIALSVRYIFTSVGELGDELPQIVVPGAAELSLHEPGTYTIFHEHESFVDGRYYSTRENLAGLEVEVVSKSTGEAVSVRAPSAHMTYSLGGRSGVSVLSFDIGQPGDYRISAGYPGGRDGPRVVLAVGQGFGSKLFTTILGGLGLAMLSLVVPVAIAAVTFSRRRRASETPGPGVGPPAKKPVAMQDTPDRSPRSLQDTLIFGLIGLIALITIAILLQRPFEWRPILVAFGFMLITIAWAGMYFRLKRELPDHPLAGVQFVQVRWGYRSRAKGRFLVWRLVRFHFERHRFDLWSMLLIAGLMLILAAIVVVGVPQAVAGTIPFRVGE